MSIEKALNKWDESIQRVLEIVKKANDEGVDLSIELKNILCQVTNLNNGILGELNKARRKLLQALKDIQSTTAVGEK
jgi:hypothetical protein